MSIEAKHVAIATALAAILDAGKTEERLRAERRANGLASLGLAALFVSCPAVAIPVFAVLFALAVPVVLFKVAKFFLGLDR